MTFKHRALIIGLAGGLSVFFTHRLFADQVFMKDGTVYKGKILVDGEKSLLIGNPPYDPVSYYLEVKDIDKIIYEEYIPPMPAERKRGFGFEMRLNGIFASSSELSLNPSAQLYTGGLFRVHPFFELEGGIGWTPTVSASGGGLQITSNPTISRQYDHFWAYTGEVGGRFYPFFMKPWKTEPYVTVGYGWSRLIPNASGDHLSGAGWHLGVGASRPLTHHLFLEARFVYESLGFDSVRFLGQDGTLTPEIKEHLYELSTGLSYRF